MQVLFFKVFGIEIAPNFKSLMQSQCQKLVEIWKNRTFFLKKETYLSQQQVINALAIHTSRC